MKPYVSGVDELSRTYVEMKGQLYMHAGTLLLKMAQHNEAQWRAVCELAALCYLISFQVSYFSVDAVLEMFLLYMRWTPVFLR